MMNCKEAAALLSRAKEEGLPLLLRLRLWVHVTLCSCCGSFEQQIFRLKAAAKSYQKGLLAGSIEPPHRLSDEARTRVEKRLENTG